MSFVFPLPSARFEVPFAAELPRRAARLGRAGRPILEAAHGFDLSGRIPLESPRQVLIRAIGRLERSDWAILFTVAMAIAAIGMLGILGMRLASLGPRGAVAPPPSAAVSSTQAFQSIAPPAPAPAAVAQPTAAPAPPPPPPATVVSTVDAGAPGAGARLRSQPRIDGSIVERVVHGSQVTELGTESTDGARTWRQVRSASGAVGWMDATLLRRPTR